MYSGEINQLIARSDEVVAILNILPFHCLRRWGIVVSFTEQQRQHDVTVHLSPLPCAEQAQWGQLKWGDGNQVGRAKSNKNVWCALVVAFTFTVPHRFEPNAKRRQWGHKDGKGKPAEGAFPCVSCNLWLKKAGTKPLSLSSSPCKFCNVLVDFSTPRTW